MLKFYGSAICSTCRDVRSLLDSQGIAYEYIDITANIANLRAFLALRDSMPAFDAIKQEGRVGLPAFILDDGTLTLETGWLEQAACGCADC